MKLPPLLLGATLVFWGWQTDFLGVGAIMAVVLEGARMSKARWEFTDQDFTRIWLFCSLVLLATLVYAFTASRGPADFAEFFQNPSLTTQRGAGNASARTAASMMRWLPMIFFPFVAAQAYSAREGVPLEAISLILRRRWKRARERGLPVPATRHVNVSYVFFGLCLFSAGVHSGDNSTYFWGACLLLGWVLWRQRSPRYPLALWGLALALAVGTGYFSQRALGWLPRYLDTLNPQWLSLLSRQRFDASRNRTELGQIGRIKGSSQIVIRIESKNGPVPQRLREASYRTYGGRTWRSDLTEKDWADISSTEPPDGTTYLLLPGRTNSSVATIGCYLHGGTALLPLPGGTSQLDNLMAYRLQASVLGSVLDQGPGLVVFDARFGSEATLDSPPSDLMDLDVPLRETVGLDRVIADLNLAGKPRGEVLETLRRFFQEHFTYGAWQETQRPSRTNGTAVSRFLLRNRKGHCEYFATATVLLLRQLGIPARYAVGYVVHEGKGRNYVVRLRDAHAWCLVWDEATRRWEDFDTTPPTVAEDQRSMLLTLGDAVSRVLFEFSKFRWGQSHWRRYLLLAVVPVLLVLLYQILFRRRRRHRGGDGPGEKPTRWPGLDSEFYRLEEELVGRGIERPAGEPLSDWLRRAVADPGLNELREPLEVLLRLHYRYRFDPEGLGQEDRGVLSRQARECLLRIRRQPRHAFAVQPRSSPSDLRS